jgi:hypothetical protein
LWKPPYDYPAVKRSAQMVPKFTGEMRWSPASAPAP